MTPTQRKNILIIEDSTTIRMMVAQSLEKHGFQASFAEDIREIETAINEHQPEIVVLDLTLPRLKPVDAVRVIRQRLPDTRIIIYSGQSPEGLRQARAELHAFDAVQKEPTLKQIEMAVLSAAETTTETKENAADAVGSLRMLLVDDDPVQHTLVKSMFREDPDIVVKTTASTMVASMIREHLINVVLVDVGLPGSRQGPDLVQFLRQVNYDVPVTFLLYSGRSEEELKSLAAACGADGYVIKRPSIVHTRDSILSQIRMTVST